MSLIFVEGFDHHQSPLLKWDFEQIFQGKEIYVNPTGGRNGGGCAIVAGNSSGAQNFIGKNIPTLATVLVGFAFYFDPTGGGGADSWILEFMDGGSTQIALYVDTTGHFYFAVGSVGGGTVIGTKSTNAISLRNWHYIEVEVTIDPSAGVAILNVDGSNSGWLNLTGKNTRATSNSFTGQVRIGGGVFGSGNSCFYMFDDLYIANTSGSFNNSFLGDVRVQALMPTGNGTSSQYTQNEASWIASTVFHLGQQLKDSNGNIQVVTAVTSDAKSGGSAPTWATSIGVTTTDNHVTWTCRGASSQFLDINQNPPEGSATRTPNALAVAVSVGTAAWDTNGNLQLCTTAGTTSSSDSITWNATIGGTTTDGSVVWTNLGPGEDLYLSDATVGHISRFTFPALSGNSVFGVSVTMRARKDDASTRSIRGCTLSNGTTGDNGADLAMTTSYQTVEGILESDPHTGVAWTISGVNAAEFGVKTTA